MSESTIWVCDTVTGARLQRVPFASFTWERLLNSGGSGSATLVLTDEDIRKLDVRDLTMPLARTLVLDVDGDVVYAGSIDSRKYDHASGILTIQHSDIWTILGRRLAIDHTVPESKLVHQVYTTRSSATVAKKLVLLGITGLGDMNMSLPISFLSDATGPITRTYFGYHFPQLGDVLRDVMNEDGGTDIDFRPRWVSNALNWEMRTGTVAQPQLVDGDYSWRLGADKSGVHGLTVVEDATKLSTASYAIGEGSEEDMLARSVRLVDPIYPYMDRLSMLKTVDSNAALTRAATGDLDAFKQPTEQWGFAIAHDGTPKVTDLLLGGRASVWVPDDSPWLSPGKHENRIIGFSGGIGGMVDLMFQPEVY